MFYCGKIGCSGHLNAFDKCYDFAEPTKIEPVKFDIPIPKFDIPRYNDYDEQSDWITKYGCHHLLGPAFPPKFLP